MKRYDTDYKKNGRFYCMNFNRQLL